MQRPSNASRRTLAFVLEDPGGWRQRQPPSRRRALGARARSLCSQSRAGAKTESRAPPTGMDIHVALNEVTRWCAQQTEAGDPEAIEVECHATVWITVAECAPPWRVRVERRSSSGASAPVAQLRYDAEHRDWRLHHGAPDGWCCDAEAVAAPEIGALLAELASDRNGRFLGLPPDYHWFRARASERARRRGIYMA